MDYEIKDGMIISPFSVSFDQRQVFEYAGTDWNGFLLYFEDGKLNSFYMQYTPIIRSGEKLQPFDSERVTTYLDNILGAHETYLKECKGYTAYIIAWRLNSVIVMLSYDEGFRGTLLQMVPKMDICAPEGYNRIF